jgi:hypothetical protein
MKFFHTLVRILPEASKIDTNLFLTKISTSKRLVCLLIFLQCSEILLTLDTCMISSVLLCICGGPKIEKLGKMSLKTARLIF